MGRSKRSAGTVAGLPDDPLVEILSRVPAKSVCRFRCVSKAWRGLIDDPLNRRKLPQTLEGFFVIQNPLPSASGGGGGVGHFDFINFLGRSVPLDVYRCFSFLTKLPETDGLFYEDSCNGLFLFRHYRKSQPLDILGYIVCNPATKHWGTIPLCGCCSPSASLLYGTTFLAFDPSVSSHFHLIQFWEPSVENPLITVLAYSSETGTWSHNQTDLDEQGQLEEWRLQGLMACSLDGLQRTFVNGILHFIVLDVCEFWMVAVDLQGKTKRIITMPAAAEGRRWCTTPCIGMSQGRLHYINYNLDAQGSNYEFSVWVLEDYDTQEWVLKHTVSFLMLFGRMTVMGRGFDFVAVHPNCNVVFFRQPLNRLIAYGMDRREVSVVASVESHYSMNFAPYIPYFSESPGLTNKH